MNVIVNGQGLELEADLPLLRLLERLGRAPAHVAIERNGDIIEREQIAQTVLRENDRLEIVHFVGGG